ncbi:MAG: acetyl-CoA carboxylase biotin carboxyl carrier protein [Legionellales bacterium]|nr:acetyl-CoA carboxylase biotin carboxyl carrier protein [Legionellales bacterium]
MDLAKVRSLIKMLDGTDVGEIEIKEGEHSVRITRQTNGVVVNTAAPAAPIIYQQQPTTTVDFSPAKEIIKPDETIKGHALKSPMVGTAYLSSSPDAEPFVRLGQRVEVGDIICIVEAMKMFNQIEADMAGIITGRLVENGQPVEYGQTLFIIE